MYTYDESLFEDRWIGPPGEACINPTYNVLCVHCVYTYMPVTRLCFFPAKALEQFWDAQRETRWFQNHPILSKPVAW